MFGAIVVGEFHDVDEAIGEYSWNFYVIGMTVVVVVRILMLIMIL